MALVGIGIVLLGGLFMIHCDDQHGGMDPDLCAMTIVAFAIVPLVGPLVCGRLAAEAAAALVPLALVPLDLPPKTSRS